uniref:Uncharacterized protein n=1 Tax=Lepeophtheirus salmonis TaxID=72036 RepID=A0A0K2UUV7_LEPSM
MVLLFHQMYWGRPI